MSKSNSGFIYLWFDRKHKRYYIGSHWGKENDGYICSSNWMRDAYRRRPQDFKRRIIARVYTTRKDLLIEEYRWLQMIKPEEMNRSNHPNSSPRYYNLRNHFQNHWAADEQETLSVIEKMTATMTDLYASSRGDQIKQKISNTLKTSPAAIAAREKLQEGYQNYLKENGGPHNKGIPMSQEHKEHLRKVKTGKKLGPNKNTKAPYEKIKAYLDQGYTNAEIAKLLGVKHAAICNAVSRAGGSNSGTAPKAPYEKIKALQEQGYKITEIAEILGVTQPAISNAIRRSINIS